jgi:hypothetical protein
MKKIISILVVVIFTTNYSFSQKKEKQVNFYHNVKFGEQYGVFLETNNVVSKFNYAKLSLIVNNKTDDFLLFYKNKCKFIFNKNSYFPKTSKKGKIIKPNRQRNFTIKSAKETNYLVDYFSFTPDGFYTFSSKGKNVKIEPFHLPAEKNIIEKGPFKINMLKLKKATQETVVKFEFTYTGNKIAVLNPANCVLRTSDGKEWANTKSKDKLIILQKNESKRFTVVFQIPAKHTDMQFAEMDIVWKNTFNESELKKISFNAQTIEIDPIKLKK